MSDFDLSDPLTRPAGVQSGSGLTPGSVTGEVAALKFRVGELERRIAEKDARVFPAPKGLRPATFVIAPSDSTDTAHADLVLPGSGDQDAINDLLQFGSAIILDGSVFIDGTITLNANSNTSLIAMWPGQTLIFPDAGMAAGSVAVQLGFQNAVEGFTFWGNDSVHCFGGNPTGCWIENTFVNGCRGATFGTVSTLLMVGNVWTVDGDAPALRVTSDADYLQAVRNNFVSGAFTGSASGIDIAAGDQCDISHNLIQSHRGHGIRAASLADSLIIGNRVDRCGRQTNNTYDGIILESNVDRCTVEANRVKYGSPNQHRYGINNAAASNDRNLIRGNHLYQSGATASFNDAGTNTNVVDANGNYV